MNKYEKIDVGLESQRMEAINATLQIKQKYLIIISGWFNATSMEGNSISLFEIKGKETDRGEVHAKLMLSAYSHTERDDRRVCKLGSWLRCQIDGWISAAVLCVT